MIFIKKNKQFIFGILIGGIVFSFATVYAVTILNSSGVSVDTTNLQDLIKTGDEANLQNALDELYTMANGCSVPITVSYNIGGILSSTHPFAVATVSASGNWSKKIIITDEIETVSFSVTGTAPNKTYYITGPSGNVANSGTISVKDWPPGEYNVYLNATGLTSYYVQHWEGEIPYYGANAQTAGLTIITST